MLYTIYTKVYTFYQQKNVKMSSICRICASICGLSPPIKHRIIILLHHKKNTHTLAYVQFLLYLCARILKLTIRQTGRKMNGHLEKKKRENEKRAEICQDARLRE